MSFGSRLGALALLALSGCGGTLPLGHPAHTLPAGKTTVGAGVAGRVLVAPASATGSTSALPLRDLAIAPDVSPWLAARTGLGNAFEAGITATTRAIRIDGRRAFEWDRVALSIGLGASALMAARPTGGADASGVYGGGFDLPILVGWRSSADLYALWIGPRIGAEFFAGKLDTTTGPDPTDVSGQHLLVGGTAGLRAGLRHVYGIAEIHVAYHAAEGSLGGAKGAISGVSIAPAGALVVSF